MINERLYVPDQFGNYIPVSAIQDNPYLPTVTEGERNRIDEETVEQWVDAQIGSTHRAVNPRTNHICVLHADFLSMLVKEMAMQNGIMKLLFDLSNHEVSNSYGDAPQLAAKSQSSMARQWVWQNTEIMNEKAFFQRIVAIAWLFHPYVFSREYKNKFLNEAEHKLSQEALAAESTQFLQTAAQRPPSAAVQEATLPADDDVLSEISAGDSESDTYEAMTGSRNPVEPDPPVKEPDTPKPSLCLMSRQVLKRAAQRVKLWMPLTGEQIGAASVGEHEDFGTFPAHMLVGTVLDYHHWILILDVPEHGASVRQHIHYEPKPDLSDGKGGWKRWKPQGFYAVRKTTEGHENIFMDRNWEMGKYGNELFILMNPAEITFTESPLADVSGVTTPSTPPMSDSDVEYDPG